MKSYAPPLTGSKDNLAERKRWADVLRARGTGQIPPAPTLDIVKAPGTITLSWSVPPNSIVTGYRIYQDDERNFIQEISDPAQKSFTIVPTDNLRHNYFVSALTVDGKESAKRGTVQLILSEPLPPPPPFPSGPTATLTDLTSGNTAAGSSYSPLSPRNANVSKLNIKRLLYPGATTKCYLATQQWFTPGSSHVSHIPTITYDDNTDAQVAAHIADMQSRGFDGVILDWYGQGHVSDTILGRIKARCEVLGNFEFAVMIDKLPTSADKTQAKLEAALAYLNTTYYGSAAYMKRSGRPVVMEFGWENPASAIDWAAVRTYMQAHGNPLFIFQYYGGISQNGFTSPNFDGAFTWVSPTAADRLTGSIAHLTDFYTQAKANPSRIPFGCLYKGFNDDLTNGVLGDNIGNWGAGAVRSIPQRSGQTFLDTVNAINAAYSSANQLANLFLLWDDWEEDSESVSGIEGDTAFGLVSIVAGKLQWTLSGNLATVDHFTVWLSQDGVNFTNLADLAATASSFTLPALAPGTYKVRVQAVGVCSIVNKLSAEIAYTQ